MDTTKTTNEVVETVVEEAVKKVDVATPIAGGLLVMGALATIYVVAKGGKWAYKTVKGVIAAKKEAEDIIESEILQGEVEDTE